MPLRECRIAHDRNADLAAIDAASTAASVDALRYRLDGKHGQAAMLATELEHARNILRIEQPAAELATTRAAALAAEAAHAQTVTLACRRAALEATEVAQQAAAASLQALHADTAHETVDAPAPCARAGEKDEQEHTTATSALQANLESAAAEAERWRCAAEELRALHEWMAEVVVVDLGPTAAAAASECGNSSMRARLEQMIPAAPRMPTVHSLVPKDLLAQLTAAPADWMKHSTPSTNGGKLAAGAALLGAGVGLATTGPIMGTALAGVAGAAALASSRLTIPPSCVPVTDVPVTDVPVTDVPVTDVPTTIELPLATPITPRTGMQVAAAVHPCKALDARSPIAVRGAMDAQAGCEPAVSKCATSDVLRLQLVIVPAASRAGCDLLRATISWL